MINYPKFLSLVIVLSLIMMCYCTDQPTKPGTNVSIQVEFVPGHTAQLRLGKTFNQSDASQVPINNNHELKKIADFFTIDQAMVMILDFSAYDTSAQYFASEDYKEYVKTRDSWPGDLSQWAEWEKLLGDYFRIVVDQSLNMEKDRAKGTVSGVIGLNYIVVALIESGKIQYWGEGEVKARAGEIAHALIYVW
ncbi:MAG: hypothetical protein ACE5NG_13645 [bacterium]